MTSDFEPYPDPSSATATDDREPSPAAHRPRDRRRLFLGIGGALAVLLILSGAWSLVGALTAVDQTEAAAEAGMPQRLELLATSASVTVVEGDVDRPTFRYWVRWASEQPLTLTSTGETLTASLTESLASRVGPSLFSGSNRLEVTVPRGTEIAVLEIRVDTGSIGVPVGVQSASLHTNTGSIQASQVHKAFHATANTGSVHLLGGTPQQVEVTTMTGDINVAANAAPQSLVLKADTGSIEARLPAATYLVDARSGTGGITNELTQDPNATNLVSAATGTGDIRLLSR